MAKEVKRFRIHLTREEEKEGERISENLSNVTGRHSLIYSIFKSKQKHQMVSFINSIKYMQRK